MPLALARTHWTSTIIIVPGLVPGLVPGPVLDLARRCALLRRTRCTGGSGGGGLDPPTTSASLLFVGTVFALVFSIQYAWRKSANKKKESPQSIMIRFCAVLARPVPRHAARPMPRHAARPMPRHAAVLLSRVRSPRS